MNRLRLGSVVSEWRSVDRGCPRGSFLDPLMWNLCQNDLAQFFKNTDFSMYADDHQVYMYLYVSDNSIESVQEKLNTNGEIASQWYRKNFLQGNKGKYNVMLLSQVKDQTINATLDGHCNY